jgi:predicted RNA-binding Zn-ribbon protein involved in translation (DUF1610 family)
MFEETIRTMKQLNGSTYTMKIEVDKNGFIDKECPNENCLSKFKIFPADWEDKEEDDMMHCPFCGNEAPFKSWYTTEQIKQSEEQAFANIKVAFDNALKHDIDVFNRNVPKNNFIKMSMKFQGSAYAPNLPAAALGEMEQIIICEACGSKYVVVGSAFYCPSCGHNSARQTFNNTLEKVKAKIDNLDKIYEAIASSSKDDAVRTCDSLIETSIPDLVVAFQRLCECIYPLLNGTKTLSKNIFQRLDDGNNLWKKLLQKGYEDWSSMVEYSDLKKCFQQRHILQHKEGIVDQEYIDKSGDFSYKVGQRLKISNADIIQYLQIVNKIGNEILKLVA